MQQYPNPENAPGRRDELEGRTVPSTLQGPESIPMGIPVYQATQPGWARAQPPQFIEQGSSPQDLAAQERVRMRGVAEETKKLGKKAVNENLHASTADARKDLADEQLKRDVRDVTVIGGTGIGAAVITGSVETALIATLIAGAVTMACEYLKGDSKKEEAAHKEIRQARKEAAKELNEVNKQHIRDVYEIEMAPLRASR